MQTIAGKLHTDAKVKEAKEILLDAVKRAQSQITAVKPAEDSLRESYKRVIKKFEEQEVANTIFMNYQRIFE